MSVRCEILPYTCLKILAGNKWPVFHKKLKMGVTCRRWIPWTKMLQSTRLPVPHPLWRCCHSTGLCESLKWILRCNMNFEDRVGLCQEILTLIRCKLTHIKTYFLCIKVALEFTLHYSRKPPQDTALVVLSNMFHTIRPKRFTQYCQLQLFIFGSSFNVQLMRFV